MRAACHAADPNSYDADDVKMLERYDIWGPTIRGTLVPHVGDAQSPERLIDEAKDTDILRLLRQHSGGGGYVTGVANRMAHFEVTSDYRSFTVVPASAYFGRALAAKLRESRDRDVRAFIEAAPTEKSCWVFEDYCHSLFTRDEKWPTFTSKSEDKKAVWPAFHGLVRHDYSTLVGLDLATITGRYCQPTVRNKAAIDAFVPPNHILQVPSPSRCCPRTPTAVLCSGCCVLSEYR